MLNFISLASPIAKLAHGENRVLNHSLSHSSSLFDAPGTNAFASEQLTMLLSYYYQLQQLNSSFSYESSSLQ